MSRHSAAIITLALGALLLQLPALAAESSGEEKSDATFGRLWEQLRPSGTWRQDYYASSKDFDTDQGFLGTTLQLKALPALTDRLDGKLELRATNSALNRSEPTQLRILEAYARWRFTRADLYLGKQIVAWGRADGINPTDNLTPRDYTVMLPFEDDQRFGIPSVRLDTFLSQAYTLTFYATPFFEPARVPLPHTPDGALREQRPAQTLSNTQAGVRLNRVAEGFDWSVSYYRGYSLLPTLEVVTPTQATRSIGLHYDKQSVIGADFARNYGRFGFRGEAAYVDTADDAGTDPGVKNPYFYWVVGVDRTFYEYLNVNLQFFQRRVRHHRDALSIDDPLQRQVGEQNAIIHLQQDAVSNGITFRVSQKWLHETLEAELFAAINLTRDNAFVRPLVTYAFDDHWKVTVGAELYGGAGDTQYGSLKKNRGGFAEVRYGF